MRLLSVVAARPNFVKLAAVHHAIAEDRRGNIEHIIVHTGQHYDPLFSDVFFEELKVPIPTHNLGVHGGTREEVIAKTEEAMTPLLTELCPDCVLVYGDVNGAVGAARAVDRMRSAGKYPRAAKIGDDNNTPSAGIPARDVNNASIKLAHVEAGLRSGDLSMPEEHNRIAIDESADFLLCSEDSGLEHLAAEGVRGEAVLVGNTMIDTLIRMLPRIAEQPLPDGAPRPFGVVTLHRPSNVDTKEAIASVLGFLAEVSQHCPLILPVHHRLQAAFGTFQLHGSIPGSITLLPPLPYLQFLRCVQEAAFILTDSGGIQEEAAYLKKRCFTLRRNTERPSTIASGSNVLIDPAKSGDREAVLRYAETPADPVVHAIPLWDGGTGRRIVDFLRGAIQS